MKAQLSAIPQIGEWFYWEHYALQVEKRTRANNTAYLWANGTRYPVSECSDASYSEADINDAVNLCHTAETPEEISEVLRVLKIVCTPAMKADVWARLSNNEKAKLWQRTN